MAKTSEVYIGYKKESLFYIANPFFVSRPQIAIIPIYSK